jgi:hypothetical protein
MEAQQATAFEIPQVQGAAVPCVTFVLKRGTRNPIADRCRSVHSSRRAAIGSSAAARRAGT